jgi:glucosamine kinase
MMAERVPVAAEAAIAVLAVDGGQSAIRVLHSEEEQAVEVEGVSRGESGERDVVDAVADAWRRLGAPPVDRAVLGLTTAPGDGAASVELASRVGRAVGCAEVWIADDAVTSHAGALSLRAGVSLTAGTGVACLALPADGEPVILGGHGYLLGDEGGGYWIGREGLRAVLRATEHRAEPTALVAAAAGRFGAIDHLDVRLHDAPRPVDSVARFAADVLEASAVDPVARRIVAAAALELRDLVLAAAGRIGTAVVAVGLGGRVLESGPLRAALDDLLRAEPSVAARSADRTPLEGAMLLARSADPGPYAPLVHVWRAGEAP